MAPDPKKDAPKDPPKTPARDSAPPDPKVPPATTTGTREQSATALQPFDVERPSATSNVDEVGPDGRPQAREGLKPQDNERPHPTAAARPGKSSGMAGFAAPANLDDLDADEELTTEDRSRLEVKKAREDRSNPIQVEATALGYYDDTRRRPGEVFFIYHASEFSSRWMRRTDGRRRVSKPKTGNEALQEQHRDMKRARTGVPPDGQPDVIDTGDNPLNA